MKKVLLFSLLALFFSSCFSVKFIEPQPKGAKNQKAIPDKLWGTYLLEEDSIFVGPESFTMDNETFFISDSMVIRKFKKFTVLNMREKKRWDVYLIGYSKHRDVTLYSIHDEDYEDGRDFSRDSLILAIGDVCEINKREFNYLVNPSKSQFKKLVKKDIFRRAGDLKRVD